MVKKQGLDEKARVHVSPRNLVIRVRNERMSFSKPSILFTVST
jgi:hypothetical protein